METMMVLTVFWLGVLSLSTAILTGLVMELPSLVVGVTAAAGSLSGVLIISLIGERLKVKLLWQSRIGEGQLYGQIYRIWNRYGVIWLGLLMPLLFNTALGTALAVSLGIERKRMVASVSLGIFLWSIVLTVAGTLGWIGLKTLV